MSGSVVVVDRPEVITATTSKASQMSELYDRYEPLMCQLCIAMEALHSEYLQLAAPVALDMADILAEGRCIVMDDFIAAMHAHSVHLKELAHSMRTEFNTQRHAACNLAKLAR
jgi:hypothetical protein